MIDTHGLVTLTHAGLLRHSGSSALLVGQPNSGVSPLRPYRICSPRPTKPLVVQARIGFKRTPPGDYQHAVVASPVFVTDPKADFRLFQQ